MSLIFWGGRFGGIEWQDRWCGRGCGGVGVCGRGLGGGDGREEGGVEGERGWNAA